MLDAIAGLSALAAGILTPVGTRRAQPVAKAEARNRPAGLGEDRLELAPGHIHEEGQECPLCGTLRETSDDRASAAAAGTQQAPTGGKPGASGETASQLSPEQQQKLAKLKKRDQEVRAHEQAHQATGGQYAGGATFSYQVGPDGQEYAIGGEVSIDLSPVPGNPQATIAKMEQIRRAALAPAQPSAQDQRVAAEATQIEARARAEAAQKQSDQVGEPGQFIWREDSSKTEDRSPYSPSSAGEPARLGTLLDIAI
jgi:hypothetical protein